MWRNEGAENGSSTVERYLGGATNAAKGVGQGKMRAGVWWRRRPATLHASRPTWLRVNLLEALFSTFQPISPSIDVKVRQLCYEKAITKC